ncbi:hypothetical protein JAAARDRAFT_210715 [Jaapia argillacea MUCL 33604]|uniref:MYND-type domain-containing protein n=1 Tax=Jaapia argillacea MUCL 33604 TaxID=933084 RepID=A0A067PB53_9AGAM|nr:hypothetical protein JAAARDRAFT_210715 [Jaapia argillacea MUCL 33604]
MSRTALGDFSQKLKQCQTCFKAEAPGSRLLSCSACKKVHYCDKECQKKDWGNHKTTCKKLVEAKDRMKSDAVVGSSETSATPSMPSGFMIEKHLKPWIQIHRSIMFFATVNALTLQRTPKKFETHTLSIDLTPAFTETKPPIDQAKAFHLKTVRVVELSNLADILWENAASKSPINVGDVIARMKLQSEAMKKRGGMGAGVVAVKCGTVAHCVPFAFPEPDLSSVPVNNQWMKHLREKIERGERL